jgi:protein-S-isoprenylcysteine O-methyltransferase Ste14
MIRLLAVPYALVAYAIGMASLVYAVGFAANLVVPKSIDVGGASLPWQQALVVDVALLTVFALQHSVMARPGFKRWWTRIVPPAIERSTYVLIAGLLLTVVMAYWAPIPTVLWSVDAPAVRTLIMAVSFAGWATLVFSTFLINHFNLFGLSQVFAALRGRSTAELEFRTPLLYRLVRHPIYLGFLMAFWATPDMTVGHFVFALTTTVYILIAIVFEERDLVAMHGDTYRAYRQRVRMLLPVARSEDEPRAFDRSRSA